MTLEEFLNGLKLALANFERNLDPLALENQSKEEWMIMLLKWLEWQTEVHDYYWKE